MNEYSDFIKIVHIPTTDENSASSVLSSERNICLNTSSRHSVADFPNAKEPAFVLTAFGEVLGRNVVGSANFHYNARTGAL